MPSNIAQGFNDCRVNMPWWVLGALVARGGDDELRSAINRAPQAAQVGTVTVTGATNAKTYQVTINGFVVSFLADASATIAEIADGLALAINSEPAVRGQVSAVSNGVSLVTITGNLAGISFTNVNTNADAQLTVVQAATAAAVAAVIPFGRAVIRQGWTSRDELVALAASALFAAQVITASYTFVTATVVECAVYEIRGGDRVFVGAANFVSATDVATSTAGLIAALNTNLPPNTVNVTGTTTLVFTAEVIGTEWDVEFRHNSGGASTPVFTVTKTTGPSEATSFHRAFRGVTVRDQAIAAETIAGAEQQFPGNWCLDYCRKGTIAVESAQTVAAGDDVFVELATGADSGKFFNSGSATRVALSRAAARWEADADSGSGNLAALRLM